jgi:hypothetical protein
MKTKKFRILYQSIIALSLPVIYFYLLGGFNNSEILTGKESYDPLSVSKIDFMNLVEKKEIKPQGLCGSQAKDTAGSWIVKKIAEGQSIEFIISHDTSAPGINTFKKLSGCLEKDSTGTEILYLSSGRFVDGYTKMNEGFAADELYTGGYLKRSIDSSKADHWYLRPKMKIRTAEFSPADTRPVVSIIISDFEGQVIDSMVIKVLNFSDLNGKYDGTYTDKYLTEVERPGNSFILRNQELFRGYGTRKERFEIKVYWFGAVDVWFEKITLIDLTDKLIMEGQYLSRIENAATLQNFDCIVTAITEGRYRISNKLSLNYVLNVIDNKLKKNEIP